MTTTTTSRRAFLQRASALSIAGVATPWALNLAAIGEAAAATATDYKALVCVFLYGGNDYGNTLIPYDSARYTAYQGMRPTLAYARSALAPTLLTPSVALPGAIQYAIAPELESEPDLARRLDARFGARDAPARLQLLGDHRVVVGVLITDLPDQHLAGLDFPQSAAFNLHFAKDRLFLRFQQIEAHLEKQLSGLLRNTRGECAVKRGEPGDCCLCLL